MTNWTEIRQTGDLSYNTVAAWRNEDTGEVIALAGGGLNYVLVRWPEDYIDAENPVEVLKRIRSHKDNALAAARQYRNS